MAEIDEVVQRFHPVPGVEYYATVLNQKGVERAAQHPVLTPRSGSAALSCHMCDTFVRRNSNRSQADEIARWLATVEAALRSGATRATIGLAAAWGSNFSGEFTLDDRMAVLRRQHGLWSDAGIPVRRVMFADSMSWCLPHVVEEQLDVLQVEWPEIDEFYLHLHDARGMALPSIYAALRSLDERHDLILDTTAGGIGGCPYCGNGRATGMAATEDVVHMLEAMGYDTGIDLDRLIEVVWQLEELTGRPVPGRVAHAGPRPMSSSEWYDPNLPVVETYEEATHFKRGESVIAHADRPWREPIPAPEGSALPHDRA